MTTSSANRFAVSYTILHAFVDIRTNMLTNKLSHKCRSTFSLISICYQCSDEVQTSSRSHGSQYTSLYVIHTIEISHKSIFLRHCFSVYYVTTIGNNPKPTDVQ